MATKKSGCRDQMRSERVGHWRSGWETGYIEGMASAAVTALESGDRKTAEYLLREIKRRFSSATHNGAMRDLETAMSA